MKKEDERKKKGKGESVRVATSLRAAFAPGTAQKGNYYTDITALLTSSQPRMLRTQPGPVPKKARLGTPQSGLLLRN